MGITERERIVHGLAIDGQGHRLTYALIVPGRIRIPLFRKIEPERRRANRSLDSYSRRALQLLGQLATDGIGDIDLATLQGRQPRGFSGDHFEHQLLDSVDLTPIALECMAHQFDARGEGDELVRTRPNRSLLEAGLPDSFDILLRHYPAGTGGAGVEGEEVWPWRL